MLYLVLIFSSPYLTQTAGHTNWVENGDCFFFFPYPEETVTFAQRTFGTRIKTWYDSATIYSRFCLRSTILSDLLSVSLLLFLSIALAGFLLICNTFAPEGIFPSVPASGTSLIWWTKYHSSIHPVTLAKQRVNKPKPKLFLRRRVSPPQGGRASQMTLAGVLKSYFLFFIFMCVWSSCLFDSWVFDSCCICVWVTVRVWF